MASSGDADVVAKNQSVLGSAVLHRHAMLGAQLGPGSVGRASVSYARDEVRLDKLPHLFGFSLRLPLAGLGVG